MDVVEGLETGSAFSLPSPMGSSILSLGLEAHSAVSSAPSEGSKFQLSSSEEIDVLSIKAGDFEDSPPQVPAYEELIKGCHLCRGQTEHRLAS